MSINSAMIAGVSALRANSSALAGISNNIANVNTTAYKREDTSFADIVTEASSPQVYSAGGVRANTAQKVSALGSLQGTTSTLDLGIDGQGFFIGTEKNNPTAVDARVFTRAGSLSKDKDGYLKNAEGFYFQGWPVDNNGLVTTDPSDITKLKPINIANVGGTAEATTKASIVANLNAEQAISTAISGGTYNATSATAAMSVYNATTGNGTKPDFEMSVPASDSKGGQRNITLSVIKSATSNTWNAELWSKDVTDGSGLFHIATGTLVFKSDGTLDTASSTLLTAMPGSSLTINESTSATNPHWNTQLGVAQQSINLDLSNITQFSSSSATSGISTNGTAFGNVQSVQVGKDGMVTAIFDNGVTRNIAQIGVASFNNPDALQAISGNAYSVTNDSGTYTLKIPNTGGAGKLATSQLEASTVDLSTEFTGLITTQRAYSAASKIITTADQMMQELLNIIR